MPVQISVEIADQSGNGAAVVMDKTDAGNVRLRTRGANGELRRVLVEVKVEDLMGALSALQAHDSASRTFADPEPRTITQPAA